MSGPAASRIDSIRQRLLNHAREHGEEFRLTLDRYAVERGSSRPERLTMSLLYTDPEVAPLRRSSTGSITPILEWLHWDGR